MGAGAARGVTAEAGQGLARAEALRGAGRLAEAEAALREVLAGEPDRAEAVHLMALVAHQSGRIQDAIGYARRATELAPNVALFHANLGEMCRLAGRHDLALAEARAAIALDPANAQAYVNAGAAHYERKEYEAATEVLQRGLALEPDYAAAHCSLGNALYGLRRFDEAVDAYRRATALKPDFADAWGNLGTALHHGGRYDEAITALRRAIALDPDSSNARSGLGILLLMRGDFAEGWEAYEWRLKSTEVRLPYVPQRPWRGEPLAGRRIYVHGEQGFGDTIQFARYLPRLAARGAAVTFRVQQGLLGLIRASFPAVDVIGDRGAPAGPADVECALLSLPFLFGTRLETIPATTPYLVADQADAARWRARLAGPGLKVGVAWAGNPEHVNDARRSVGLPALAPVFETQGVSFVSLQVGGRAADLREAPWPILDVAGELVGFAATAALVGALDLVITVDSAVAHLAGALGKPVWLLAPWVSDWRWLLGRDDSPWYPTLTLYRQARGQDWREVTDRLALDLRAVAAGDAARLTPFRAQGEQRAREAAEIIAAEERTLLRPARAATGASASQLLAIAEQRRQSGKLAEAALLARRALEAEPANAEACHLLGIVAHQSGNLGHAIEHVSRAAALDPANALYHANLGEMLRLAGRTREAAAECEAALALQPDHADALNNLGIVLFERGDFEGALERYERAIALRPGFAQAHSNRGNALRALKRLPDAVGAYERALALNPNFAEAWNNLGTTLRDLKRLDPSVLAYERALALKPDDPDLLNSRALALKDIGRTQEALATFRRSLAIDPPKAATHLYLGVALLEANGVDEAGPLIEEALRLEPENADVLNAMGRLQTERGAPEAAIAWFDRALEKKPDVADALNNMGNALKELGRLGEARLAFERSLALDPKSTGAYVNFADSHRFTPGDPHLAAMEALAAEPDGLSDTDRLQLDFALAKAYADLKDHAKSFERLARGAAAKRARIDYDEESALELFGRIEKVFTASFIEARADWGAPAPTPVFIVGMPRSGSSLVEQILASHPAVFGAGELTFLNDVAAAAKPPEAALAFPHYIAALGRAAVREIGEAYLARLTALAPGAARITDKMPSNYYFAGLIGVALPGARIVHTVRDPLDTCVSCFSKLFAGEQNHTYDLGELGRYYRRYERMMAHWRRVLPKDRLYDLSYEALVADLEGETRKLLAFLGLPWDDRCLAFERTSRPVRTASATQVREPVFDRSIGRWRAYAPYLGPLYDALGVKPDIA